MTGTLFLSLLTRPDVARELTFTARMFDGREALALGLATRVSETPYDDALALAREIAGRSPDAVRGAKALLNRLAHELAREQFAEERRVIGSLIGTPNQVESVMANFEQRPPVFTDPA
jgi:enoyl-CoA hydratase/carnithine racemase